MPYREGSRLPGERASRLGHLEVLKSDLVKQLCQRFEDNEISVPSTSPGVGSYSRDREAFTNCIWGRWFSSSRNIRSTAAHGVGVRENCTPGH